MTAAVAGALLREVRQALGGAGIREAGLESDVLVRHALGMDRAALLAHPDRRATRRERQALEAMVARRLLREPLPYITGLREFYGLEFRVCPWVLVPRPETETLVEAALRWAADAPREGRRLVVADVGTGSGCIAVSLAAHLDRALVLAADISREALSVARRNALRHGVGDRVHPVRADLLGPLTGPLDLVMANLPYVPDAEVPLLEPEIARFEPREALCGGPDGTALVRRLMAQAARGLSPGGALIVEIDPRQRPALAREARRLWPEGAIRVAKDLAGNDRVLTVETGPGAPCR